MQGDRTLYVPKHIGRNVFPCHSLFTRLIRFSHQTPARLCVHDDNTGKQATHIQLLSDVLALRERLLHVLSPSVRHALDHSEEVYIAVLAPGGYEYTVGMLAALATGAAVVPMTVALPAEEALYFARKAHVSAVLVSEGALQLGLELEMLMKYRDALKTFPCVPIEPSTFTPRLRPDQLVISSDTYLNDSAPGVVIFTSGVSDPPEKLLSVSSCCEHH